MRFDDRHYADDARRYRRRLRRQREYQATYRERLKGAGIPETRDLAAAALEEILAFMLARPDRAATTAQRVARWLPERFDRPEAERRLMALCDRRRPREGA